MYLASQIFLVDINDACANPGTICASVTWFGSHGISRLHVCVDVMFLTFVIVMMIGLSATCKFLTGAPSTRKWHVAPESEIAYLVVILSLSVLGFFCALLEMTTVSSSFSYLFSNSENLLLLCVLFCAMVRADLGYASIDTL